MSTYRYNPFVPVIASKLNRQVVNGGAVVASSLASIDISLNNDQDKPDLDAYMAFLGSSFVATDPVVSQQAPLAAGFINGCLISRASASTVGISTGECRADDDSLNIPVSAPLVADLATAGVNGLDTGVEEASTLYSVWVIAASDFSLPVASLLSKSQNAPILPNGYDKKRLVGWVRNDVASDLLTFVVLGNGSTRTCYYVGVSANIALVNGAATAATAIDVSALVPPGVREGIFFFDVGGALPSLFCSIYNDIALSPLYSVPRPRTFVDRLYTTAAREIGYAFDDTGGQLGVRVDGYVIRL